MPSNHLILCHPLLLLPSIFPSIRVFSNELVLPIRWPKYWSFSFSLSPSNAYSGPTSCRMDWLVSLRPEGPLSLLQHHGSRTLVLWRSAFFMVQLSHPYTTAGKTIALPRRTFVGQVMSLLFNMQWFWSQKIKSATVCIVPPSIHHKVMGPDAMILVFWTLSFSTLFFHPRQQAL